MNHILVFVDLTETAKKTVTQAIAIAKMHNKTVEFCHVAVKNKDAEAALDDALIASTEQGVKSKWVVLGGDFYEEAVTYVKENLPYLVLVATHGKKGLKQNLWGSNIYKLVTSLGVTTLVLSEQTEVSTSGFKKVLVPVSSHPNYLQKVQEAVQLMHPSGKVLLFAISKPGKALSDEVLKNIKSSEKFFAEKELNWEMVKIDMQNFSIGYSKDTLSYAKTNEVDMIAILNEVTEESRYFGKMDKENLMINKDGISILCVG